MTGRWKQRRLNRLAILRAMQAEREDFVKALAWRSYHLPGYTYWADFCQFILNNHPMLGICFHHKLHPIATQMRIINFIGSVMFGLAITNLIYLWLVLDDSGAVDQDHTVVSLNNNDAATTTTSSSSHLDITEGMIILWTVGGTLHALFDQFVWHFTTCVCCLEGQALEGLSCFRWCGSYLVVMIVVMVSALASLAVVLRAMLDVEEGDDSSSSNSTTSGGGWWNNATTTFAGSDNNSTMPNGGDDDDDDDQVQFRVQQGQYVGQLLLSYAIELVVALFVYHPLLAALMFSGVLGCGRIPILGGRPYQARQEEQEQAR